MEIKDLDNEDGTTVVFETEGSGRWHALHRLNVIVDVSDNIVTIALKKEHRKRLQDILKQLEN